MKRILLLAAAAGLLVPGTAAAQACIGVPTMGGQFAIAGGIGFPEGGTSYNVTGTADLTGPLSLQANFGVTTIDDVDENATTFGGRVAYELPVSSFSACPVVGADYFTWSEEAFGVSLDINQLVIPVGVGVGTTLAAGTSTDVLLFAVPQLLYVRNSIEGSDGEMSEEFTDSDTEFGANIGARLVFGSIFAGAGVSVTTVEDSDATFDVALGFVFGGR